MLTLLQEEGEGLKVEVDDALMMGDDDLPDPTRNEDEEDDEEDDEDEEDDDEEFDDDEEDDDDLDDDDDFDEDFDDDDDDDDDFDDDDDEEPEMALDVGDLQLHVAHDQCEVLPLPHLEQRRIYHYPEGTRLVVEGVAGAGVCPSGLERLQTMDGVRFLVKPGWLALEIHADGWTV